MDINQQPTVQHLGNSDAFSQFQITSAVVYTFCLTTHSSVSIHPQSLKAWDGSTEVRIILVQSCLSERKHTAFLILLLGPDQCTELVHLIAKRHNVSQDDGGVEELVTFPCCLHFGSSSACSVWSQHFFWNTAADCVCT